MGVLEDEVRRIVLDVLREELPRLLAEHDGHGPWLTVEQAADLVGTSRAAIHTRLSQEGWMAHARIREGKRVLIERAALLAELEQKKGNRG